MLTGKLKKTLLYAGIPALLLLAAAFVFGYIYYCDNRRPNFPEDFTVFVYPEMTSAQVLDTLCAKGNARSRGSLERCASKVGLEESLKPGKYVFQSGCTSIYAIRKLANGWQSPHNLTLSGTIRTKQKLARMISSQRMTDSLTIDSLLRDDSFLSRYGFDSENVFAMFLPDTYQVYWTDSPEKIFDRFRKEYDRFWTKERLEKAAARHLTPMQVSVLASIVSGESLKSFEYPVIAGVYLNRLRRGQLLQADPTVAFCFDYSIGRILKKHLQVDSPYNTYKYKGLPPAPINVPPKACIDAVLNPQEHNYYYFCASPDFDGTHRFATTFEEHKRNARQFQRALTIRMKEKAQS